jgi:hypothetical protein
LCIELVQTPHTNAQLKGSPMSKSPTYKCHPYFKLRKRTRKASAGQGAAAPTGEPWSVPDLCTAYNWPSGLAGGGVIAIVELGGGWVQSDMNSFFQSIDQPTPSITDVSVDGTQNTPGQSGSAGDADYEVALDIEVAGASYYAATGQAATIRVYWSQDIGTAVQQAAQDGCAVCSISWGSDEANWGNTAAEQMESTAQSATAAGMVVFAASGDNDSSDGGQTPANVDCPSSCPHVVGCGGTNKTTTSETVWNDNPGETDGEGTGGGDHFSGAVVADRRPARAGKHTVRQRAHGSRRMRGCRPQHRLRDLRARIVDRGGRHKRCRATLRRSVCILWNQARLRYADALAEPGRLQ